MGIATLVLIALFNLLALAAIFLIGRSLFSGFASTFNIAVNVDPVGSVQNRRIKKYSQQLKQARTAFESANFKKTASHLEKSFYTDPPLINLKFLDAVHDHNFDVLSFVLHMNKILPGQLRSLPELERLIQNRMNLLRNLAESYLSLDLMKKKRKTEGKDTPEWAVSEFTRKIERLKEDLAENDAAVSATIQKLCDTILKTEKEDREVSFH